MGLDDELCRQAKDLYGWELQFAGDYRTHPQVEISEWVKASEHPLIGLGVENIKGRPTYGFVDRSKPEISLYQPFAIVYAGRNDDYQEDLVRAALLHLRRNISEKQAEITFPLLLQKFVRSHHLWLLQPHNPEVKNFIGEIIPIYREGDLTDICNILKDFSRQRQSTGE